jgi:hypothetical protein
VRVALRIPHDAVLPGVGAIVATGLGTVTQTARAGVLAVLTRRQSDESDVKET